MYITVASIPVVIVDTKRYRASLAPRPPVAASSLLPKPLNLRTTYFCSEKAGGRKGQRVTQYQTDTISMCQQREPLDSDWITSTLRVISREMAQNGRDGDGPRIAKLIVKSQQCFPQNHVGAKAAPTLLSLCAILQRQGLDWRTAPSRYTNTLSVHSTTTTLTHTLKTCSQPRYPYATGLFTCCKRPGTGFWCFWRRKFFQRCANSE